MKQAWTKALIHELHSILFLILAFVAKPHIEKLTFWIIVGIGVFCGAVSAIYHFKGE